MDIYTPLCHYLLCQK